MIRQVFGMLYCHRQIEIDRERNKTFVNERQEHFSHEGLITALHFIYSFLRFDKNHKSHTSLQRINCQSKTSKLRWLSRSAALGTFDTVFTTPDCFVIDILFFKLYKLFKNKRFVSLSHNWCTTLWIVKFICIHFTVISSFLLASFFNFRVIKQY